MTDITALRLQLRKGGFHPLPLEGKVPHIEKWEQKFFNTSDDEIRLWPKTWHLAHNTGLVAKFAPGLDIDILIEPAAEAVEALAREHFEEHGNIYVRFGLPPKRLIPLRTDEPFTKLSRWFTAPDGTEHKIEILSDGQQYVVDGIHPDTGKPYGWFGGDLATIKREDLPYVRREDMEKFLDAAAKLLVEDFGFVLKGATGGNGDDSHEAGEDAQADPELIAAALAVIPNNADWDQWNAVGMATWRATGGSGAGFEAFDAWSRKSPKYDARVTAERWAHYFKSPPTHIGAGTIFHLADQASPDWRQARQEQPSKQRRFQLKPFDSITLSTEPNYRVMGILPRVGLVVVWGPPKCGKSFWTFDLVLHIALGWKYRGRKVQQGTVVYLALEGGPGFAARKEAWRQRHLADHDGPVPFNLIDVPVDLVADHKALIEDIEAQITGNPDVVVIDTLNRSLNGSENKPEDMARYIRAADSIRARFGGLVIIIHHCGVEGSRPRGHTSLTGADDAQIAVYRDKDGNITVTVEHMKDGDASAPMGSKLERVEVGINNEGDPITSCVIVPTEIRTDKERTLPATAKLALEQLRELIADIGECPAASNHIPPNTKVCSVEVWREHFYNTHPGKPDTKQKAFVRAATTLQKARLIGIWNDKAWLAGHAGHGQTFKEKSGERCEPDHGGCPESPGCDISDRPDRQDTPLLRGVRDVRQPCPDRCLSARRSPTLSTIAARWSRCRTWDRTASTSTACRQRRKTDDRSTVEHRAIRQSTNVVGKPRATPLQRALSAAKKIEYQSQQERNDQEASNLVCR